MYDTHIQDMTNKITKALNLTENQAATVQKSIKEYWEDRIALTWTTEDVIETAKDMDITLTNNQAREILEETLRGHDADIGVNWEVLRTRIADLKV
jgi:hypothetical protein